MKPRAIASFPCWILICLLCLLASTPLTRSEHAGLDNALHDAWFHWVNAGANARLHGTAFQSALICAPSHEVNRLVSKCQQYLSHLKEGTTPPQNVTSQVGRAEATLKLMLAELASRREGARPSEHTADCQVSHDRAVAGLTVEGSTKASSSSQPGLDKVEDQNSALLVPSIVDKGGSKASSILQNGGEGQRSRDASTGVQVSTDSVSSAIASITPKRANPSLSQGTGPSPQGLPPGRDPLDSVTDVLVDTTVVGRPAHQLAFLFNESSNLNPRSKTRIRALTATHQGRRSRRLRSLENRAAPSSAPPLAEAGLPYARIIKVVRKRTANWISQLSPNSTVLVGNSYKLLLADPPMGSLIDGFDDVIRFNSKRMPEYESATGSKTTVMVMGDFEWTCGCNSGECCNHTQVAAFWERVGRPRAVLVTFKRFFESGVFWNEVRPPGVSVHELGHFDCDEEGWPAFDCTDVQYIRATMLNTWLDAKRAEHPGLTSRIPWGQRIRTGTQTLMLLLFHGLVPTIAGYDLGCQENSHFYNKDNRQFPWYSHETPVLLELVREGLVRALDYTVPELGQHQC